MCYYITATLPKDTELENLRSIIENYNMDFTPINNPNIQSQLRSGELYLRATKSYCDCSTIIGSLSITPAYKKLLKSQKVKTLKKKKWTEDQIHLWILEKLNKGNKPNKHNKLTPIEKDVEINNWISFLRGIFDDSKLKRLGLLKHWYSKGLTNEEFLIKKTERIRIKDLSAEIILNLEENVLYEFHPFS